MTTTKFYDPILSTLAVTELRPVDGAPGLVTLIAPSGNVVSCDQNGNLVEKPDNFDGAFERAKVSGNLATWQPKPGTYYTRAFVLVAGL